jgi:hypothetical protein
MVLALLMSSTVWAQDDPDVEKKRDQIEQLSEQMKQLGRMIDSLSSEVEVEVEEAPETREEKIEIKIDRDDKENLTNMYSLVYLGPTFVIDNEASDAESPDFSAFRSWSGQLGFTFVTRFGPRSPLGIEYGLVYQFTELDNREDYIIDQNTDGLWEYAKDGNDYQQSELYAHNLTIPLAIRINDRDNDKFSVSLGGFAGLRLGGTQETKTEIDGEKFFTRQRTEFGLPDFNYGASFGIGGDHVQWYSTYQINSFFDSEEVYDWNVITTGIRLTF